MINFYNKPTAINSKFCFEYFNRLSIIGLTMLKSKNSLFIYIKQSQFSCKSLHTVMFKFMLYQQRVMVNSFKVLYMVLFQSATPIHVTQTHQLQSSKQSTHSHKLDKYILHFKIYLYAFTMKL